MSSTVSRTITIDAEPDVVFDLVADVARVGRFSPEATGARGAGERLREGDTFWGTNRRGPWFWATHCRVTRAQRGEAFAFTVDIGPFPVSSWSYQIEPADQGCTVTETWVDRRTGIRGAVVARAGALIIPGPRDEHNARNIDQSLAALKRVAEAGSLP